MKKAKQLGYFSGLMIALFLCIGQATAEYGVCYVPPGDGYKKDVLIAWGYDASAKKFAYVEMYSGMNGKYTELEEKFTGLTAETSTTMNRFNITWSNSVGSIGNLSVDYDVAVSDRVSENNGFAEFQIPGQNPDVPYYRHHVTCAMTSSEDGIKQLLPKLQKTTKVGRTTNKIPAKL